MPEPIFVDNWGWIAWIASIVPNRSDRRIVTIHELVEINRNDLIEMRRNV